MDFVVEELALVVAGIEELEDSLASLGAIFILSFVLFAIGPLLDSKPILLVVLPLADVLGAVGVGVGAVAVGLVVEPLALVDVAVGVVEHALPVGLVVDPLADVLAAVRPALSAVALPHCVLPLPFVGDAVVELDWPQLGDSVLEGGLDQLIVLGSLAPIHQVGVALLYLPVSIGFRLSLLRAILPARSCSRIFL
jgi:hypothetical protein